MLRALTPKLGQLYFRIAATTNIGSVCLSKTEGHCMALELGQQLGPKLGQAFISALHYSIQSKLEYDYGI